MAVHGRVVHLPGKTGHYEDAEGVIMLAVLGLVDVVMIANLLIMVIVGGYETFVSRIRLDNHPDQPEWLSHVNANVLKVKLAMAIIGISSIHLLKTFIDASNAAVSTETMMWQTIIHMGFVASAVALAYIDRMSRKDNPLGPSSAPSSTTTRLSTPNTIGPSFRRTKSIEFSSIGPALLGAGAYGRLPGEPVGGSHAHRRGVGGTEDSRDSGAATCTQPEPTARSI